MSILFNLAQSEDSAALTVIVNGQVKAATHDHPNWSRLKGLIDPNTLTIDDSKADELLRLMDPGAGVQDFFQRVSERVTVCNGHVLLDHEPVNDELADNILAYMDEGADPAAYVNFLEKVVTNPNEHSREQLYRWLSKHDFAITPEGNFLAYKGVNERLDGDDLDKYPYCSSSQGKAIVDGAPYNGQIPNGVGAVVEMPRSEVQHDPSVGCHTGLHAGTYEYASTFTHGPVLLVEINPRDVVSVPTDCNDQKIRTCRYVVKEVIDAKLDTRYYSVYDENFDEDDDVLSEDEYGFPYHY